MNMALRFAVAAAAVVAVAVVGVNLLPRQGESVGPGASPTPALTPAPTPALLPTSGDLDAGAYYIAAGPTTPARLTFRVPAGWSTSDGFVYKGGSGSGPAAIISADLVLVSWLVSHVYADICQHEGSLVEAGSTADELAAVLLAQNGPSRVGARRRDGRRLSGPPHQDDRPERPRCVGM
jgi:hypothetical protein